MICFIHLCYSIYTEILYTYYNIHIIYSTQYILYIPQGHQYICQNSDWRQNPRAPLHPQIPYLRTPPIVQV
jgi:hypothetical protein